VRGFTEDLCSFFEKKESKKFGRIKKSNNAAIRSRI